MSRVENYSKKGMRNLISEHNRTAEYYSNEVDRERTHLNFSYGLADSLNTDEMCQEILTDCMTVEMLNQEKLNNGCKPMSEWVVTYPERYCHKVYYRTKNKDGEEVSRYYNEPDDMEHCKKFFDELYRFTSERYNNYKYDDNNTFNRCKGMYVHMDETTPHGQIVSCPVCVSKKTGKLTVSSSSFLKKSELRNYQKELEEHMRKVFNTSEFGLLSEEKFNQPDISPEQDSDYLHNTESVSLLNFKKQTELEEKQRALESYSNNLDNIVEQRASKRAETLLKPLEADLRHEYELKHKKLEDEKKRLVDGQNQLKSDREQFADEKEAFSQEKATFELEKQNYIARKAKEEEEREKEFQAREDKLTAQQDVIKRQEEEIEKQHKVLNGKHNVLQKARIAFDEKQKKFEQYVLESNEQIEINQSVISMGLEQYAKRVGGAQNIVVQPVRQFDEKQYN